MKTGEDQHTEETTIGRNNATTLLYVSTPRPFLGAPRPTWVLVDVFVLLLIMLLSIAEIVGPFYMTLIVPVHIAGVVIRAWTPHTHELLNAWIAQPRAHWRGLSLRRPRARGAKGIIDP